MAIFTKEDRIEISKKLTGVDKEIQAADDQAARIVDSIEKAEKEDAPNKKLMDDRTLFINPYQNELKFLDGNVRTELTEQVVIDSAKRTLNNSFFPNNPATPLPSVSDGVWKNLVPFAGNHGVGKTSFETYDGPVQRTEQDIIDEINAAIVLVEAESIPERATGQQCEAGTPPALDTYSLYDVIQDLLTEIKTLVQEWEDMLNDELITIPFGPNSDPNTTRQSGNDTSVSDINNAVSVIDTWQTVQDFDITTSLPSDCDDYYMMVEGDFEQAKLQPTTLQLLKDELLARASYIAIRESELAGNDYLGGVNQDVNSGEISAFNGLYGERMRFIDLRLNASGGTLSKKIGLETASNFTGGQKANAENARAALSLVMAATLAIAPGIDTKYLNVKDASQFSAGDRVYVVANDQEELSGSIVSVNNNRIELTFNVPKKYTTVNQTRLYKIL